MIQTTQQSSLYQAFREYVKTHKQLTKAYKDSILKALRRPMRREKQWIDCLYIRAKAAKYGR